MMKNGGTDPVVRVGIVGLENGHFSRRVRRDAKRRHKFYVMSNT
jgi:hypothetical protein